MFTFKVYMQNGEIKVLDGKNIGDAFIQNSLTPALMGSIDYFFRIPKPIEEKPEIHEFQIYLMESPDENWEEFMKPSDNFIALESMMKLKVKRDGCFSGIVVDLFTEKPVSWLCSEKATIGIYPTLRVVEI